MGETSSVLGKATNAFKRVSAATDLLGYAGDVYTASSAVGAAVGKFAKGDIAGAGAELAYGATKVLGGHAVSAAVGFAVGGPIGVAAAAAAGVAFDWVVDSIKEGTLDDQVVAFGKGVGDVASAVGDKVTGFFSDVGDQVGDFFGGLVPAF